MSPIVTDQTSVHVRRAAGGDSASIEWVVSHFYNLVEAQVRLRLGPTARTEDIQDLTEDVWLAALPRLGDLTPREGRYAPVLARFLGTTTLQLCNNFLRKQIRRGVAGSTDDEGRGLEQIERPTRGVVTRVAEGELRGRIQECFQKLPPAKRDVLVLRLLEQRGNQEIAEILNLQPNTVAVRYRRALEDLRGCLPEKVFSELRATRR